MAHTILCVAHLVVSLWSHNDPFLPKVAGLHELFFIMLFWKRRSLALLPLVMLFPLAGLDPGDNKALFVLPAAMFLISTLSFLVEHIFVPGSPIDLEYFMEREILSDNLFIFWVIFGIVLAVLYVTLFRKLYPRLPAWLRSETVNLTWKDLRLPGILWAVSTVIGLVIVI
jgi:hypothetical protein